jgi:16S rRNA (uracil1498-N3)-methyltransferase
LAPIGSIAVGRDVLLDPSESRHAVGSLRLSAGDGVVLADGAGTVGVGELVIEGRNRARVLVESVRTESEPAGGLVLAVAVLAGSAMDLVAQKAVEIGVHTLAPVITRRSQLGLRRAAKRSEHWRRVALQAIKQCQRAWAMEILAPIELGEMVVGPLGAGGVVAHRDGGPLGQLPPDRGRLLLIGPEGGFNGDEEQMLERAGWPKVRLGRHVLRSETAAIIGAAGLLARIEDKGDRVDD